MKKIVLHDFHVCFKNHERIAFDPISECQACFLNFLQGTLGQQYYQYIQKNVLMR